MCLVFHNITTLYTLYRLLVYQLLFALRLLFYWSLQGALRFCFFLNIISQIFFIDLIKTDFVGLLLIVIGPSGVQFRE